ncbi:conserved hypothetical protein [Burkholderia gladioli]|nr:conserved hypothetical protein [Burkholderia gladioli]
MAGWAGRWLLFLCNRQAGDTIKCLLRIRQKQAVKWSKKQVKTTSYQRLPFLLFLVSEKVISLFACGDPRVHP